MPDTSLTLANLKDHFRRYLAVYVVCIAVALILSNLLWTVTTPRIATSQSVVIYMADSYYNDEPLSGIADDMLNRARAYDDTLRSVEFQGLLYSDTDSDYSSSILLMTRLSINECDAFLASPAAMDRLVSIGGVLPLDSYVEAGWLGEYPLEPYYVTLEDEETGERLTQIAGFRLDDIDALARMGAFNNEGAFLAIAANSDNLEATLRAVEVMIEDLVNGPTEVSA